MSARLWRPARTLILIGTTGLLTLTLLGALLWFGLPWLVLGLILAAPALILSIA